MTRRTCESAIWHSCQPCCTCKWEWVRPNMNRRHDQIIHLMDHSFPYVLPVCHRYHLRPTWREEFFQIEFKEQSISATLRTQCVCDEYGDGCCNPYPIRYDCYPTMIGGRKREIIIAQQKEVHKYQKESNERYQIRCHPTREELKRISIGISIKILSLQNSVIHWRWASLHLYTPIPEWMHHIIA